MIGEGPPDERAHRGFGGMIGGGHGVEAAVPALILDAERGAEERQDDLAGDRCQLVHESREVDRRHAPRPSPAPSSTYRRSASPATAAAACRPAGGVPRSRAGPCSAGAKAGFMSISGASRAAGPGVAAASGAT